MNKILMKIIENIEYGEESKVVCEELRFKGFGLISS